MYQSIDDSHESINIATEIGETTPSRLYLYVAICGVLFFVVTALLFQYNKPSQLLTPHNSVNEDASLAFRKIQNEPLKYMRKARLIDFVKTHDNSSVINGAKAQLSALKKAEAQDWAKLSDQLFASHLSDYDKSSALEDYVKNWGEGVLGTRDGKIKSYRDLLDPQAGVDSEENLDFTPNIVISNSASGSKILAGAPPSASASVPIIDRPVAVVETESIEPVIERLRVKKASSPIYPSRALRRGIPALVKMRLNVNDRGRVEMVEVVSVKAERYERDFIRASKRAARRIRFHPKTVDGVAVPVSGVEKSFLFDPELMPRL